MKFSKQLGRGYFGEVWKAEWAKPPKPHLAEQRFAVKKVPMSIILQHKLQDQMDREIEILQMLRHKNIVELHFHFKSDTDVFLGMEFAAGGGMFDSLSRQGKFSRDKSAQYMYEGCDALAYLHGRSPPVIHRDIKPENILFDGEGHVQLCDFGWSNVMQNADLRSTFCGTPDYLAPEMIRGEGHNESLDMWEMGVLLYEMTVGKSPFGSNSQEATCRLILQVDLRFPADMDPDAQNLVTSLCRKRPDERLTARQSMEHTFCVKYCSEAAAAAEPPPEREERPSVAARGLLKDKQRLEGEMMQVLNAKCATEATLLKVTEELQRVHEALRSAQKAKEDAAQEKAKLEETKDRQLKEMSDLKSATDGLQAEVARLKSSK